MANKLYIANCTNQVNDFIYFMPEARGHQKIQIPIGEQVVLNGLNDEAIKAILEFHANYGLVDATKINQSREFIGLCYSPDPIKMAKVKQAMESNFEVLDKQGKQLRTEAAIVANQSLAETSDNVELKATEVSVKQVDQKDRDIEVDDTVRVTKNPDDERSRSRGRK